MSMLSMASSTKSGLPCRSSASASSLYIATLASTSASGTMSLKCSCSKTGELFVPGLKQANPQQRTRPKEMVKPQSTSAAMLQLQQTDAVAALSQPGISNRSGHSLLLKHCM